ncbi:DUF7573 domain-containing protein [Halorussus halobius]|uniref:DUF7573 domain-containing protein n=1 Tax=Halorussus halobius TaxID=1710537 RepID=UPI001092FBDA|nr:hypothetical protein [Halorussus halobius]
MTDDATLDAFDSPDESDGDAESDADDSAEVAESSAVAPARSTFEWTPAGGECADCGRSAERRWRRDGQREGELVCPDCKAW